MVMAPLVPAIPMVGLSALLIEIAGTSPAISSPNADHALASRTARVTKLAISGILNWL